MSDASSSPLSSAARADVAVAAAIARSEPGEASASDGIDKSLLALSRAAPLS